MFHIGHGIADAFGAPDASANSAAQLENMSVVQILLEAAEGELKWHVPHGDTSDAVRNSPVLKGMNIPKTGQPGSVGLVVTKTLVILGDPSLTTTPEHPRGAMLRAYDKQTGKEVGAVFMPAPQSGSPMTYSANGKQYIIVSISGGNYSGEYLAFSLPDSEIRPTTADATHKH